MLYSLTSLTLWRLVLKAGGSFVLFWQVKGSRIVLSQQSVSDRCLTHSGKNFYKLCETKLLRQLSRCQWHWEDMLSSLLGWKMLIENVFFSCWIPDNTVLKNIIGYIKEWYSLKFSQMCQQCSIWHNAKPLFCPIGPLQCSGNGAQIQYVSACTADL